jgi:TIR domain-containing protein
LVANYTRGPTVEVPYLSVILSVLAGWAMGRLRIFLCYRRDDTRWVAGRLYDELRQRYGREQVFQDITAIRPGIRYTDQIQEEISRCDVLVVVMGEGWLLAADPQGRRRLDSPRDLVRLEIAAALQRGIPIIPVLVQRASMPADVDLPDDIADLTLYHACEVTDTRWDYDVGVLLKAVDGFAGESVPAETSAVGGLLTATVAGPVEGSEVIGITDMPYAAERREQSWQAFIAAIEDRGFRQSERSARLYYHPRTGKFRIKRMQTVIRIEEYRPEAPGRDWQLWQSYSVTAFESVLKIIDKRLRSSAE